MRPAIGLSEEDRTGIVAVLNALLSDEYVLYTKTRNYHWNVVGPQFHDVHRFLELQYEELSEIVDEVAERTRALGGWALGTLQEFLQHTRLSEHPEQYPDARTMLANLLADHEAVIRTLRQDIEASVSKYHDMGTSNFLTELMGRHEKMAWMLRAFLEGKSV
jgi:starvation-inducible DNA-binding protein